MQFPAFLRDLKYPVFEIPGLFQTRTELTLSVYDIWKQYYLENKTKILLNGFIDSTQAVLHGLEVATH